MNHLDPEIERAELIRLAGEHPELVNVVGIAPEKDLNHVILTLEIRDRGTAVVRVHRGSCDPLRLMDLLQTPGGTTH